MDGMRRVLLLGLLFVLIPKLCAADDLLILALLARVTPAGQVQPVPDPFIESILNGGAAEAAQGVQALPRKTFQINSWPKDFESEFDGIQGQRIVVSFTALVLPNGSYAVTDYRVIGIARGPGNQLVAPGSSELVSRGGFTITPGRLIPQSVTARFEGGVVTYYLIFSAAKGVAG
jgi:hypothetical protein